MSYMKQKSYYISKLAQELVNLTDRTLLHGPFKFFVVKLLRDL